MHIRISLSLFGIWKSVSTTSRQSGQSNPFPDFCRYAYLVSQLVSYFSLKIRADNLVCKKSDPFDRLSKILQNLERDVPWIQLFCDSRAEKGSITGCVTFSTEERSSFTTTWSQQLIFLPSSVEKVIKLNIYFFHSRDQEFSAKPTDSFNSYLHLWKKIL